MKSIDISKKITKIGEIFFIENDPQKIGEKSFTKKSENFSESTTISIKKSPKSVTFYSLQMSPKFVKIHSPKKVNILVTQQKFL